MSTYIAAVEPNFYEEFMTVFNESAKYLGINAAVQAKAYTPIKALRENSETCWMERADEVRMYVRNPDTMKVRKLTVKEAADLRVEVSMAYGGSLSEVGKWNDEYEAAI